ncbi:ROK family transcriptional regulator [Paenibacillus aurantius]|uniref:ROK family transcriptional regulator n=1 Tax=Paenibacillus aurantius TaxID=2918900 RepID=A0AA96L9F0_9BACL|nr:ROK family transcriptional regulator [Paenibacillus aurantius]WNQ09456.1 ROK family transcriptional regulator [Paenibacillus aurantius]
MSGERLKSHQLLKSINQHKVMYLIHSEGPISRVELAEKTGLTQQTVTNIVNRLLEQDMVREGEPVVSSGGRKPVPLTINGSRLYAIGIEVAGKFIRGTLMDFRQERIGAASRSVSHYESEEHLITLLRSVMDELIALVPDPVLIKGAGMSIQGLVDSRRGVALRLPGIGWGSFPLKEKLEELYGIAFYMENDVNLLALGENMNGSLNDSVHNITLKFDYGIGGAICAGKELVTGSSFVAGEFGHYKAFTGKDAKKCHCGGYGCLTTLVSESGLMKNEGLSIDELADGVRAGEPDKVSLYERMAEAVCLAVSNVVTFLNPDHLLVTGSVLEKLGDLLLPELHRRLPDYVPETCRGVKIIHLQHKPDETELAVGLVVKKVFEVPVESLSL